MRDLVKGRGFVVPSHYGLVEVLRAKSYARWYHQGLWGYVRDDTHSLCWETGALTPLSTISLKVALDLVSVLYAYLLPGMSLDKGEWKGQF